MASESKKIAEQSHEEMVGNWKFPSIASATEKIISMEDYLDGSLFLNMWVDTWLDPEDQKLFERLEHTGENAFYVIRRAVN